jgi:hypothetical protein
MTEAETPFVRADEQQAFDARRRLQARFNIRAAKMADPVQAVVHGLGILALTPLSPPAGMISDEGGSIIINKTSGGNWSSDGNDTPPEVGPWLIMTVVETEETVPGPSEEDGEPGPDITQNVRQVLVTYWEDGEQDSEFDWRSETMLSSLAEDLFSFRYWSPFPNTEDTTQEDDSVPAAANLWLQPIEPPPPSGGSGPEFVILSLPDYLALDPEVQMDGRWYVIPKP